jgi:hypothetical protein
MTPPFIHKNLFDRAVLSKLPPESPKSPSNPASRSSVVEGSGKGVGGRQSWRGHQIGAILEFGSVPQFAKPESRLRRKSGFA